MRHHRRFRYRHYPIHKMTTFQEDVRSMVRSFRFAVVVFALTIFLTFASFTFVMMVYMPSIMLAALETYYSDKEFVITE